MCEPAVNRRAALALSARAIAYNQGLVTTNKVGKGIMVMTPRTSCVPRMRVTAAVACA